MSRVIMLDAGPLGLVTNPKLSPESVACAQWLQNHITAGSRIIIPEITDYEVRRELLRANKIKGLTRLDDLAKLIEYLPIGTVAMRQAAKLWAQARQQGKPTSGDKTIDADVILVAQAMTLGISDIVIATTNVGHLSRFISAELWQNVTVD
ncbi:PIN domain-containing protein [Pseudanabaena sp. Chao 1811]|uniref:PIN domain-containing protein n=1 Tax=Pseudanabaena sp. Chao 1811 TaxID=2963092 RepID=UPI0022F38AC6|nr:PIN domain-containing protein [Pseudanabaena sp. Chao 1811]